MRTGFEFSITGQPLDLGFAQHALATEPVHDLQLRRAARRGAQEPVAPRRCLVEIAGVHQRQQRQRRVAEPAEAIVPVADPPICSGSDVVGAATMPPVGR